jgi:hypothetical protein
VYEVNKIEPRTRRWAVTGDLGASGSVRVCQVNEAGQLRIADVTPTRMHTRRLRIRKVNTAQSIVLRNRVKAATSSPSSSGAELVSKVTAAFPDRFRCWPIASSPCCSGMAAFTGSGHHRRSKARWPNVSYSIKAAVANRPICITSFGSFGSSPAGHRALIMTTLHSEAANSGAKRETGRCTFESCRSSTGRNGPRADL